MSHSVVFHEDGPVSDSLVVYDLSKREVLTPDILKQAILKLTKETHYEECKKCPVSANCEVHKKLHSSEQ